MEYEVEVARPRDRTKRTWTEILQSKLNREDAMDRNRWEEADEG